MPESLDLDALRESMESLANMPVNYGQGGQYVLLVRPAWRDHVVPAARAVLALVDEQRKEIEELKDAGKTIVADWDRAYAEVRRLERENDKLVRVRATLNRAIERDRVVIDDLRAENERLREALTRIKAMDNGDTTFYQERFWQTTDIAHRALAGSPAENKEPSCPACDGKGEIEDTIDQHGGGAFWTCMRCGGTGKEPS